MAGKGGATVHRLPQTKRQERSMVTTAECLRTRTADTAHRRLLELLEPGMAVLDVGCANGSITSSIARAVEPTGYAVGLDINVTLILEAAERFADVANLSFVPGDAYELPYEDHFDLVTAARTLQWCRRPDVALQKFKIAVKPGGKVIVLDYNYEKMKWKPKLPASVNRFWQAYLQWRRNEAFDPAMADRLETLMRDVGFTNVVVTPQHEIFKRGNADFTESLNLWQIVLDKRGDHLVQTGYLRASHVREAINDYERWAIAFAEEIGLYALAVEGTRPE